MRKRKNRDYKGIFILVAFLIFMGILKKEGKNYTINKTRSLPRGIYKLYPPVDLHKGDIIVFEIPKSAELMFKRGYVSNIDSLMKKLAALPGDHIEIINQELYINGNNWGKIYEKDKLYRPLPSLKEKDLIPGEKEVLALSDINNSFDGRYFGPIEIKSIKYKAKPVFILKEK
ncbi:conjugal transfer protein TraF (plasmid) [Fusobacterium varium]|nr:conjugal transfer protein TraF [Fusobacterium varium]